MEGISVLNVQYAVKRDLDLTGILYQSECEYSAVRKADVKA